MQIKLTLLCLVLFAWNKGKSHDANKAFFTFSNTTDFVKIEAELPWTAREALLNYHPSLRNSATVEDFQSTFDNYIIENFIITNKEGNALQYIKHEQIQNHSNGHKDNFYLFFEKSDIASVRNTLLFNTNNDQQNFHYINEIEFITSPSQLSFYLYKSDSVYFYTVLITLGLILLFLVIHRMYFLSKS